MNPITHLLAAWSLAEATELEPRDRSLVAWAGLAPDADGLGVVVDVANRLLGRPESFWYWRFHHVVLHGLFGAAVIACLASISGMQRLRLLVLAFVAVHLHLVCDLVGSRGPGSGDIWPIAYLQPFSEPFTVAWSGQWALNAWPNVVFTLGLIAFVFVRAIAVGHSPVSLVSQRGHQAFVEAVRARWSRLGAGV